LFVLGGRNPASPAAVKMRRKRLKMSQENIDGQRVKDRLSKNAKRQVETQEESAQRRKNNCEYMKRIRLFETQKESDQRKNTMREYNMRQRQIETEEKGAKRKRAMLDWNTKK